MVQLQPNYMRPLILLAITTAMAVQDTVPPAPPKNLRVIGREAPAAEGNPFPLVNPSGLVTPGPGVLQRVEAGTTPHPYLPDGYSAEVKGRWRVVRITAPDGSIYTRGWIWDARNYVCDLTKHPDAPHRSSSGDGCLECVAGESHTHGDEWTGADCGSCEPCAADLAKNDFTRS